VPQLLLLSGIGKNGPESIAQGEETGIGVKLFLYYSDIPLEIIYYG
jgi:hypothetical protein